MLGISTSCPIPSSPWALVARSIAETLKVHLKMMQLPFRHHSEELVRHRRPLTSVCGRKRSRVAQGTRQLTAHRFQCRVKPIEIEKARSAQLSRSNVSSALISCSMVLLASSAERPSTSKRERRRHPRATVALALATSQRANLGSVSFKLIVFSHANESAHRH